MFNMSTIGDYIKKERKKAVLTQEDFAIRSGLGLRFVRELEQGKETVRLDKEDAVAVSLTLPLRQEPYETTILFPFFDGLIPEGWLLGVVSRNWKINQKDRFGLLLSACRDCIGDVCIRREKI